ncbi:hypothetical protein GCM10010442_78550 [Kitasatospora kifunensis]
MQRPRLDTPKPRCTDCGAQAAPHPGETRTTRVADGVVRDERVRRCTPCQQQYRAECGETHR